MRTRNKDIVTLSLPAQTFQSTYSNLTTAAGVVRSGPTVLSYPFVALQGTRERIHDEVGKEKTNPVIHRKMTWDCGLIGDIGAKPYHAATPYGTVRYEPDAVNSREAFDWANTSLNDINGWDLSPTMTAALPSGWSMSVPPYNEEVIKNDLLQQARQLKADALLNIVEANELWPCLKDMAHSLPEMAKNWNQIRKLLRTASSTYLGWKFGIAPIIQDLKACLKFAPDMQRRLKEHVSQKPFRVSRFIPITMKFGITGTTTVAPNGVTVRTTSYQGRCESFPGYRYVLVVKPTGQYGSEAFQKLDFLFSRFTTSPASFAWERIPFSFVVNWFVDIRSALREIDNFLGVCPYEIVSFTKSFGYDVSSDAFRDWYSPLTGAHCGLGHVATCAFKHYERSNLPMPSLLPGWKGYYGKNQAAITAALIGQRLKATNRVV